MADALKTFYISRDVQVPRFLPFKINAKDVSYKKMQGSFERIRTFTKKSLHDEQESIVKRLRLEEHLTNMECERSGGVFELFTFKHPTERHKARTLIC